MFIQRYQPQRKPVLLVFDHPTREELKNNLPFSSASAKKAFLKLANVGVPRQDIHPVYLFNFYPMGDLSSIFKESGDFTLTTIHWQGVKEVEIQSFAYRELEQLNKEMQIVQPKLIICAGRYSLYFLSQIQTLTEIKKSPYGSLLKWRGSHLELGNFWKAHWEHILLPVLPMDAEYALRDKKLLMMQDWKRAGRIYNQPIRASKRPETQRIIAPTFKQVTGFLSMELDRLNNATEKVPYAVDIECQNGYMDCIGIATSKSSGICIPFASKENPCYWSLEAENHISELLRVFLTHPNAGWKNGESGFIGQNFQFDVQLINRWLLVKPKIALDTMTLHHTMFAGLEKSLAILASMYNNWYRYWKDDGKVSNTTASDEDRWNYNLDDCFHTFELAETLWDMLEKMPVNIQKAFYTQQYRTQKSVLKMMFKGIRQDTILRRTLYHENLQILKDLQYELTYITGHEFNAASADQKKAFFYDFWGLPPQYDAKTGAISTGKEVLPTLKELDILTTPIVDRILEIGQLQTTISTFLVDKTDIDNRMRASININGTDTFRFSSSKNPFGSGGNVQNISSGGKTVTGKILPNIRKMYLPDEGKTICDTDLDSADLRIVVAESGATGLQQMLDAGLKPYIEMMKEYYHDPSKNKNSPEYKIFKAVAHGTNYVGSAAGLSKRVGLLVHEVDKLQKWYFSANPEIKLWHKELKFQIQKRGWIENIFGYRRYFWDMQAPTLLQIAAAWKPQSTVALIVNEAMNRITETVPDIDVLLQVHDSLVFQYDKDKPYLQERAMECFRVELPYEKPIIIPAGVVSSEISWGHCKD